MGEVGKQAIFSARQHIA